MSKRGQIGSVDGRDATLRLWLGGAFGAAMVIVYMFWVREWLLLALGAALVVIAMLGEQIRKLTIGREGISIETWQRRVAEAVREKVTGAAHSVQTAGTVRATGHLDIRAIPAEVFDNAARHAAKAESPDQFADALLRIANPDQYWPHISEVVDSLGRRVGGAEKHARDVAVVDVGQLVTFRVTATDPRGRALRYRLRLDGKPTDWSDSPELTFVAKMPASAYPVRVEIATADGGPHGLGECDDWVNFLFNILPARE